MRYSSALVVLAAPYLLAAVGVTASIALFVFLRSAMAAAVAAAAVSLLFMHPVRPNDSFVASWKGLSQAAFEALGVRVVHSGAASLEAEGLAAAGLGPCMFLVYYPPGMCGQLAVLLLSAHMTTLFPMFCEGGVATYHRQRLLTLPFVRVWARWLGLQWTSEAAVKTGVPGFCHTAVLVEETRPCIPDYLLRSAVAREMRLVPISICPVAWRGRLLVTVAAGLTVPADHEERCHSELRHVITAASTHVALTQSTENNNNNKRNRKAATAPAGDACVTRYL